MRIDLVTDCRAEDRDRPAGGVRGLAGKVAHRALLRELADRGIELGPVGDPPPGPRSASAWEGAGPGEGGAPEGKGSRSGGRGQHPPVSAASVPAGSKPAGSEPAGSVPPGSERAGSKSAALLLAASGQALGADALTAWLDAARAAAGHGHRVVISGLVLDDQEEPAPELAELLSGARFVGLRDEVSRGVAARLCPRHPALRIGWDDALLLAPSRNDVCDTAVLPPRIVAVLDHPSGPFGPEEALPVLVALLDALVHRTGSAVTLAAATGAERDARFCAAVAARLPEDVRRTVVAPERAADAVRSGAEYVVTTSREAVALALPGGSCVLPVAWTSHAERSMQAVLDRWGLVEHVVPLAALLTPGAVAWDTRAAVQQWCAELVERRAALRAVLLDAGPTVAEASGRWWDAVAEALRGSPAPNSPEPSLPSRGVGAPVAQTLRRRYTVPPTASTGAETAPAAGARAVAAGTAVPSVRAAVTIVLLGPGVAGQERRTEAWGRVLDGVLRQTFTDWRLVVVGTGTGDEGLEPLLAGRGHRLAGRGTAVRGPRTPGAGAAVNRGLRAEDSEFVLVLAGAADAPPWPPTLLQRAVAHLEHPLAGDDGVVVRTVAPGSGGGAREQDPPVPGHRPAEGHGVLTLVDLLHGARALPGPFLYRRAVHDVLGDYDETLTGSGEWEFALRFLETFTVGLLPGTGPLGSGRHSGAPPRGPGGDELVVRERYLKQWTTEHGIGLPLHLGRAVEEQADGLHRRLDDAEALTRELLAVVRAQADRLEELERTVARRGLAAFCRRIWQAVTGR